jgi:hypothetical protein
MIKTILTIAFLLIATSVYALRVTRPISLTHPITKEQVVQLNRNLDDLWNIQNGRFELDIVTTTKTNSRNGEIWIWNDAGTYKLQFKAGDAVRTITP